VPDTLRDSYFRVARMKIRRHNWRVYSQVPALELTFELDGSRAERRGGAGEGGQHEEDAEEDEPRQGGRGGAGVVARAGA